MAGGLITKFTILLAIFLSSGASSYALGGGVPANLVSISNKNVGDPPIGTTSLTGSAFVQYVGGDPNVYIDIDSISLEASPDWSIAQESNCSTLTAENPYCGVTLAFTPSSVGIQTAMVCFSLSSNEAIIGGQTSNTICEDISGEGTPALPSGPIDLAAGSIHLSPSTLSADGVPTVGVKQGPYAVTVNISGQNAQSNDNRVVKVTLFTATNQYEQSVSVSSLANGSIVPVHFTPNFSAGDAGTQILRIVVDPDNSLNDPNFSNNISIQKIHVTCDVESFGTNVPFHSQNERPWGATPPGVKPSDPGYVFGPYGEVNFYGVPYAPKDIHYMRGYGCFLTDIAMVAETYGIIQTVASYSIPAGVGVGSERLPLVPLDPGTLDQATKVEKFSGKYMMVDDNNNPLIAGVINYLRLAGASACVSSGGAFIQCNQQMFNQISFKSNETKYQPGYVQNQICQGNPVTLQLGIAATAMKKAHSHFVLATATTFDSSGNLSYFIDDPGRARNQDGENAPLTKHYANARIIGQRVFVHKADPTFFQVDATSQNIEFVVTDSQGRRVGTNPILGHSYSEMPDAHYSKEFLANEDPDSSAPDQLPSTIMTSPHNAAEEVYTIDVYGTAAGTADLTIRSYDTNGMINRIIPITQTIKKGDHFQFTYKHSSASLIVDPLTIKDAVLVGHGRDLDDKKIILVGQISLAAGATLTLAQSFSVSVGTFSTQIPFTEFRQIKTKKHTYYLARWKKGLNANVTLRDDGHFFVELRGAGISDAQAKAGMQIDFQVDNVYATTSKSIRVIGDHHDDRLHFNRDDFKEFDELVNGGKDRGR